MKRSYFTRNPRKTILLGILVVASIACLVIFTNGHNRTDAAPSPALKVSVAVPSEFKFTGSANWWQGATNKTSMALFHTLQDGCFVSVQHKIGTIAADQASFQKTEDQLTATGHTIAPITALAMTIKTDSGLKQYQLRQSSVVSPAGTDRVLGGQEFGYVQLSGGYLYVEGYCNTPTELTATIPALQAITFNAAD